MPANIHHLIFDQYVNMLIDLSKKRCCLEYCNFNFSVYDAKQHKIMDVVYDLKDECNRRHNHNSIIDITNICYDDVITCKWVEYLTASAKDFLEQICPKKLKIVEEREPGCRPKPPVWCPFPCTVTTTIIQNEEPECPEPECEVIIEKVCSCIKKCPRDRCEPKHQLIIQCNDSKVTRKCHCAYVCDCDY